MYYCWNLWEFSNRDLVFEKWQFRRFHHHALKPIRRLQTDHESKCRVLIEMNSQSLPNCLQSKEHSKFDLHAGPAEQFRNLLNRKSRISSKNVGTGGPRIVRFLSSQGIVLSGDCFQSPLFCSFSQILWFILTCFLRWLFITNYGFLTKVYAIFNLNNWLLTK